MLKNQSIGLKLGIAFSSLIAVLIGVGWLGLNRMGQINSDIDRIVISRWNTVQLSREALTYSTITNRTTMEIFFLKEATEIVPLIARRAENSEKVSNIIRKLEERVESREEKELLAAIKRARIP